MQLSARGAQKTREESKKLSMYSKQWLPGDTLRVYYPLMKSEGVWDIVVGAVWGHSVSDIKGLGLKTAFIPSLTKFDENATPIGNPDITYQFSLIAKAFVEGQKAKEEAAVMAKNWPTDAARKDALKKIEEKFDTKNNMKAVKPIISKAQYMITTEVLCVKYVNGAPQVDSAAVVSAPLSNLNIDRLYAILNNAKYFDVDGDFGFLEVEWAYPANPDKGQSAKAAAPAGVTPEYRMAAQFPEAFNQIKSMFDMVSTDSETIARRATRKVDENKIKQALTQYSFLNSEFLDEMPAETADNFIKHADLVKELDVIRALTNATLIEKLNAELATITATRVPDAVPDLSNGGSFTQDLAGASATTNTPAVHAVETPIATVPTQETTTPAADIRVPDLSLAAGAPNLQQLMNNSANANFDESAVEEVNLEMM